MQREDIHAYPLTWPISMPRCKTRETGNFRTSLNGALNNVDTSLRAFSKDSGRAISNLIISSNVTLGTSKPADPGVAIWLTWDGLQICIPVDRYNRVEANLQAIHHVLEARRTELRHGTLALVRATFTGFVALPPPRDGWRRILNFNGPDTAENLTTHYRLAAKLSHPDRGGTPEKFQAIQDAFAQAKQELGL